MKEINRNYAAPVAMVRNARVRTSLLAGSTPNIPTDGKTSDFDEGARPRMTVGMD
jgi:hypothetical protein